MSGAKLACNTLFDECLKHGIEPVITLSHFEMPYHWSPVRRLARPQANRLFRAIAIVFTRYQQ